MGGAVAAGIVELKDKISKILVDFLLIWHPSWTNYTPKQQDTYVVFWLPVSVPYTGGALVRMVRVSIGGGS